MRLNLDHEWRRAILIGAIASIWFMALCVMARGQQSPPANADLAASATVAVRVDIGGGAYSRLTGACIGVADDRQSCLVLTNAHGFTDAYRRDNYVAAHVGFARGWHMARLLGMDKDADLALLHAVGAWVPALEIAESAPAQVTVTVYGYPQAVSNPTKLTGRAIGVDGTYGYAGMPCYTLGFPIVSGDSGSPVVADGKLVGLCWGAGGGTASAVPAQTIQRFVARQ